MAKANGTPRNPEAASTAPPGVTHGAAPGAAPGTAPDVTPEKLRAWWAHRQWLDGAHRGASAAEVLAATGWARSVGGAAPYLGLFARAGLDRRTVDAAIAGLAVHELPAARGCTYVVPATDFALALAAGAAAPAGELAGAEKHLGVGRDEVEKLCLAVGRALAAAPDAPQDPAALRVAVGGAVRSLGEAGKKRGLSTTLPLALGLMQSRGQIRRVPVNGRLDQQRYGYLGWDQPVAGDAVDLARRYFTWAGPANLGHFRWFSGFTAATARRAVAEAGIVPLPGGPAGDGLLILPELVEEFAEFTVPAEPCYTLLAGIDGIHLLHRDLPRLVDPADAVRQLPSGRAGKAGRSFGSEADPQTHIVLDRGRIVGFWEYDVERAEIVHQSFVPPDAELRAAVARTEAFVRDQLGDARGFSLDSPRSRAPKIAALRAAATTSGA
ncbi:crosslink repair DNA glycosylase YcaQ family protein [Kitasatospora sp. CM 4170]|uniref:DNA glycosylase AlkZ-like family protein n=1 Tax=Kitasatospora aburaviensis TaxID=67265 RepID=A0ABW1F1L4_9ACTN|nr:crosslink repair DNA glycosylase YcaQ family protein [Kitasatospora sp. CM 4170]WNM47086.1 crosslink repair DNA glycosylase YcaQ family protein [Kitasatospora sp. CM 4170]